MSGVHKRVGQQYRKFEIYFQKKKIAKSKRSPAIREKWRKSGGTQNMFDTEQKIVRNSTRQKLSF
jgi:hypothetical protein